MIINGTTGTTKGIPETAGHAVSKEEKIGLALGAVAFILVLVFFLVLGNMSSPEALPAVPAPATVEAPVATPSSYGLGEMLIMVGGVVLLLGFWAVVNRFGWLSIEAVESEAVVSSVTSRASAQSGDAIVPGPPSDVYEQIKSLTLDLARQEQQVTKLTLDLANRDESLAALGEELAGQTAKTSDFKRELARRHQTVKRLSEEHRQVAEQLQALHTLLGCDAGDSLLEKVTELQQKEAHSGAQNQYSLEVEAEELEQFWLTVKLDGKPFMSKRRQDRLLARMKVENMVIVRK